MLQGEPVGSWHIAPSWEVTSMSPWEQGLCLCPYTHYSQPRAGNECWHHVGLGRLQELAGLREHPASLAGEGGAG